MAKKPQKSQKARSNPPLDARGLARRLAGVRRRLRFVTTVRGVSWLLAIVLLAVLVVGLIDWRLHLPSLVRAVALVGVLGGAGYIAIRHLLRPLAAKADDLSLALQVEEQYPGLNDSLASTVQFLEESGKPSLDSPGLRQEAVTHALRRARGCDFGKIVDARGLRTAGLLLLVASTAAIIVLLLYPQIAQTAITRLVAPFSDVDWPKQTRLEIGAVRERIGRNELFEVRGIVHGFVPETASVVFTIDGGVQVAHQYEIGAGPEPGTGSFTVRLEAGRAKNNFRFEVHANDAVYHSKSILVSPPPLLALIDGRPSPLVHLDFPAYTDMSPQDLPDGAGNVDAVAGTVVTLRAAADRPLRGAWIEYIPETRYADLAAFLTPLGSAHAAQVSPLSAAGSMVWELVPAQLEEDRQRFSVRFRPYASGMYALHFEDVSGLGSMRLFELRVTPDPAPTVTLERPSPTRDILDLLPDADVTLQAVVTDPRYAVRSVSLDYRGKKTDPQRSLPLWDHHAAGLAAAWALHSQVEPVRLRLIVVPIHQPISLKRFRHANGAPLKEGDVLTLQLSADDFDDVSVDKEPGRSHEIEIRIISRNALDVILNQEEARVQQDLVRLEKLQQEAMQKVKATQEQLRKNGKLKPDDVTRLLDAEQQQQQIRERVGDRQEGLRSEVARILEALKNNKLQRTGTQDRMERVQSSLDRLAREELPQIEPGLTNARKEAENQESGIKDKDKQSQKEEAARQKEKEAKAAEKQAGVKDSEAKETERKANETPDGEPNKPDLQKQAKELKKEADKLRQQAQKALKDADAIRKGEITDGVKESLSDARQHQEEVQKTLRELLRDLESFASTAGIKGEAKSILEEQRRIAEETKEFIEKNPNTIGQPPEDLKQTEKSQMDKLKDDQRALEERTEKLLNKMEEVRAKREQQNDTDTANQLKSAIQKANDGEITGKMQKSRGELGKNQTAEATKTQQETVKQLKDFVKELEDQRAAELDRLAKKLREKQEQLENLAQEQERLQKKMKQAQNIADPKAREEELKRLAKRQKELKDQAEDVARQLSRMRQNRAGQAASQAAAQMEQALKRLERGQDAEEEQEEALDRLDEAQREVERTREEAEEELAREQAAKAAEEITRLKQRQEALVVEANRIEKAVLQAKGWQESMLVSLLQLGRAQEELSNEASGLAEKKLAEAQVFGRMVQKSAEAMKQAGAKFKDRATDADDVDGRLDLRPAAEAAKLQKEALRRLDQLLEALKQEPGRAMRPPGGGGGGGGGGDGGQAGGGDGLPPLIQYKLLRSMQSEINQRTEDFARLHPDLTKLNDKEQAELQAIQKDQQEVADLLDEIAGPPDEGGKP